MVAGIVGQTQRLLAADERPVDSGTFRSLKLHKGNLIAVGRESRHALTYRDSGPLLGSLCAVLNCATQ
jgi:hypothetical protein